MRRCLCSVRRRGGKQRGAWERGEERQQGVAEEAKAGAAAVVLTITHPRG